MFGNMPDLRAISARNPPKVWVTQPVCKKTPLCSKASQCRGALSCICVADRWHGPFWTSKCQSPFPTRGLLEIDSPNATQPVFPLNGNLTSESYRDNLACPCNCTYVSEACCNSPSGLVYEAPGLKLGSLRTPALNVACNATTGEFQASNMTLDVTLTP